MDIDKINYLAGLLEGEGSFGFYDCPVIQLVMTDYDIVAKARNLMCPGVRIREQDRKEENHSIKYHLHFSGSLAIQWMMTLYHLMGSRRKAKIRTVIAQWKDMKKKPVVKEDGYCINHHKMSAANTVYSYPSTGYLVVRCRICLRASQRGRSRILRSI